MVVEAGAVGIQQAGTSQTQVTPTALSLRVWERSALIPTTLAAFGPRLVATLLTPDGPFNMKKFLLLLTVFWSAHLFGAASLTDVTNISSVLITNKAMINSSGNATNPTFYGTAQAGAGATFNGNGSGLTNIPASSIGGGFISNNTGSGTNNTFVNATNSGMTTVSTLTVGGITSAGITNNGPIRIPFDATHYTDIRTDSAGSTSITNIGGVTTFGSGLSGVNSSIRIDGGTDANRGSYVTFSRGGNARGLIGTESTVLGGTSDNTALYASSGNGFSMAVNGSSTPQIRFLSTSVMSNGMSGVTVMTNWVVGQRYTNTATGGFASQRGMIRATASTVGAVGGTGKLTLSIEHGTSFTNNVVASTSGVVETNQIPLALDIDPGDFFYFTDGSTSGGSVSITTGTGSWRGN
jgi:hypothetical protein